MHQAIKVASKNVSIKLISLRMIYVNDVTV